MDSQGVQMIASIGVGAVATFCAIMLWPKTRDVAWMFIVIGTIVHYGSVIFQALELFGVAHVNALNETLEIVLRAILVNAPFIFFTFAFIVMLRRRIGS